VDRGTEQLLAVPLRAFFSWRDALWPLGPWAVCLGLVGYQSIALPAIHPLTLVGTALSTLGAMAWWCWRATEFKKATYRSRYGLWVVCSAVWAPDRYRFDEWVSTLIHYWLIGKPKERWTRAHLKKALSGLWVEFADEPAGFENSLAYQAEPLFVRWAANRKRRGKIKVGSADNWDDKKAAWRHIRHLFYHQASHALLYQLDPKIYRRHMPAHIRMARAGIPTRSLKNET
jgi:hypothetical protein